MQVTSISHVNPSQLPRTTGAPGQVVATLAMPSSVITSFAPSGARASWVQRRFQTMESRFDPKAAKGVNLVYQFNISGAGGGKWYAIVKNGKCEVKPGTHPKPTVTFEASAENWEKIVKGELNSKWAYLTRRLKIEGDKDTAKKLDTLFPSDDREAPE